MQQHATKLTQINTDISSPKDRLGEYLKFKRLSISKFAEIIKVDKSVVSRITQSTSQKTLKRVEEHSDLNVDWLLTGKGAMLRPLPEPKEDEVIKLGQPVAEISEEMVKVRFFNLTPTATFQEYCSEENENVHYIRIQRARGDRLDESACVFEIRGESMAPQIQPMARVLCHEISPTRWHQLRDCVIVIAYADRFVIKRVVTNKLDSENYLVLASDNPDYPTQETVQYCDIRCIFCADRIISQQIF